MNLSPSTSAGLLAEVSSQELLAELRRRGVTVVPAAQVQLAIDAALAELPAGVERMDAKTSEAVCRIVAEFPRLVRDHGALLGERNGLYDRAVTAERERDVLVAIAAHEIYDEQEGH